MEKDKLQKSTRSRLSRELSDKLKSDIPSDKVVIEQDDNVQIADLYNAIDSSTPKPYSCTFNIKVIIDKNQMKKAVLLRGDSVFKFSPTSKPLVFVSDDCIEMTARSDRSKPCSVSFDVYFETSKEGSFPCDLVIDFGRLPYLVQTLRVDVANSENLAALKQLQAFSRPKDGHWTVDKSHIVYSDAHKLLEEVGCSIPDAATLKDEVIRLGILEDSVKLTKQLYKRLFHTLIFLEELHSQELLSSYSVKNVPMVTDESGRIRGVWTVTVNKPVPPRTAQIALVRPDGSKKAYAVPVMSVQDDTVEIDVAANTLLARVVGTGPEVTVDFRFQHDNTHLSQLHRSVDKLPEIIIETHLLDVRSRRERQVPSQKPSENAMKHLDPEIGSNRKQTKAVNMILTHSSPSLLIINGPFGTGKTRLLAEAIRLLTLTKGCPRVLVCTQSNDAADLYVKSFDMFIVEGTFKARVMRICYRYRNIRTVPAVVQKYCDYVEKERQFVMPSCEDFESADAEDSLVVVTTLITSTQLLDVGLGSGFFTHIVIDEAAQATEPESVAALALAEPNTVIVLAGDCRQINPPVQSPWSRRGKLQRSLFRRLYKIQPKHLQVNLMTNYRCNYDILRLTSTLFYDLNVNDVSKDFCKAVDRTAHPDYHSFSFVAVVDGDAEQGGKDGSYANVREALVVVHHLQRILRNWPPDWGPTTEGQVCVVTSEYRQVQYIRQLLRNSNLSSVSVLTSRSIQGKEFQAVVLSTVMTNRQYTETYDSQPNFLSNIKMVNTAMTRAKSLVVVVGDPECLVQSKIGSTWEEYFAQCLTVYKKQKKGLMGDWQKSAAFEKIIADRSNLNVEAKEFVPMALQSDTALSYTQTPKASHLDPDQGLRSTLGDEGQADSSSDNSDCQISGDESSDPDMAACLESDDEDEFIDYSLIDDETLEAQLPVYHGHRSHLYYQRHRKPEQMLTLLRNDPERHVRCTLKVDGENAFGTVPDGSKPDILIEGRRKRNRAFDGEEVLVRVLSTSRESSGKEVKKGQVIGIFRRQRPSKFICQLYEHGKHNNILVPLDRGHPIFVNRKPDKSHLDCDGCVVVYKYSRNLRGKIHKPEEKECLPVKRASGKLFVVQYLSWSARHRSPMGIVSGYMDHGLSYTLGQKVLSVQFNIPDRTESSENDAEKDTHETAIPLSNYSTITNAFTIDPEHSRDLDDALAVMEYDSDRHVCEVGVFIADVSHFVSKGSSLDKDAQDIGMTVYDERGRQSCPMLPERLSSNSCSLLPNRDRPVLAVFQKYNTLTGETVADARFERRTIRSCCQMSYKSAQMIIDSLQSCCNIDYSQLACAKEWRKNVIRDVRILYELSRKLRRNRLQSGMVYRDVDRTSDALAHELVEEFMVCINRTVAERLLKCCPHITPILSQWEPKKTQTEKLFEECSNLSMMSCRLSALRDDYSTTLDNVVGTRVACPRLHIDNQILNMIERGLSSRHSHDVITAVCTEGFHPQMALVISKFFRTQHKPFYVCSDDIDRSELKHWKLRCHYTHFTSPIRRYIDIVCHRLVCRYLLGDDSETEEYQEEEVQEICSHATFCKIGTRRFQRELQLLRFSSHIHRDPIATVAVIEELGSGHIKLFIPYCPHMIRRNLEIRLSTLGASGCKREVVDGIIASLTISWSIDMLAENKNNKLKLPEDDYRPVSSKLWRELVSAVSCPGEVDEQWYSKCNRIFARILDDNEEDEENEEEKQRKVSNNYDLAKDKTTSLSRSSESGDDSKNPMTATATDDKKRPTIVPGTVDSGDNDDEDEDDGFTVVKYRKGRQVKPVKQRSRKREEEGKKTVEKLTLFGFVSIHLCSKMIRGLLRPIVQLINFPSGISICVEHNKYPGDCFADVLSSASVLVASKRPYRNLRDYKVSWMPLVQIEAATGSVRGSSTGTPVLLHDLTIRWTKLGNTIVGTAKFDGEFALEKKIACRKDDYACLRYFNLPPLAHDEESYGEGETAELLKSRSASQLVCHCRIVSVHNPNSEESSAPYDPEEFESLPAFGRQLVLDVNSRRSDQEETDPHKTLQDIIIDLSPYYQERDIKKTLLSVTEKPCVAQMIHLGLPYRRMMKALQSLESVSANKIVTETICGTFRGSRKPTTTAKESDRSRLSLEPLLGGRSLNVGQYQAVSLAQEQDITLIQGPPGTGKTVTGVHIAWCFAKDNRDTGEGRQVLYCAPSNEAVDVVTKNLMKLRKPNIKILRVYGKSIEETAFPGPTIFKIYAQAGLPLTMAEENEALQDLALHRRIRNPKYNSSAKDITDMESEFLQMKDRDEIPSRTQVGDYRTLVGKAEQAEIERAEIILCTCMQAGSPRLHNFAKVRQCIVDEAGQCTDPETVVALARISLEKIVLIGDHKQLQPVVLDQTVKPRLCISMFERLATTERTFMLTEQYRMHQSICKFPSQQFYDGKLTTPDEILKRYPHIGESLWQRMDHKARNPKCFIHLEGEEDVNPVTEKDKGGEESRYNEREVSAVITLVTKVLVSRRHRIAQESIRILTPYTAQKKAIEKKLHENNKREVQVSSISASQGGEADIIILSTVRSLPRDKIIEDPTGSWMSDHLGFVTDPHQINVALTRAKHGLFILGNRYLLEKNRMWRKLINHYEKSGCLITNPDDDQLSLLF
jgi:superfamily I DNA and/or RNA helicase/exoribonuclease R